MLFIVKDILSKFVWLIRFRFLLRQKGPVGGLGGRNVKRKRYTIYRTGRGGQLLYHLIASCCCLLWLTSYKYTFARTISNTYVLKKSLNHLSYRLQSLWSSFIFLKVFSSSSSLSNCILFLFICTGCGINDGFSRSSKKFFHRDFHPQFCVAFGVATTRK